MQRNKGRPLRRGQRYAETEMRKTPLPPESVTTERRFLQKMSMLRYGPILLNSMFNVFIWDSSLGTCSDTF